MALCTPKIVIKNFTFFSLQYIRMSGKNTNFNDEKIRKAPFIRTKNK